MPAPDGAFAYYSRFVVGGQHPLFCRMPRAGGEESGPLLKEFLTRAS